MSKVEDKMPLSAISIGTTVKMRSVEAGSELRSRLASLGLVPGVDIIVLKNSRKGPFVIQVRGTRLVLGRGMAHKIHVN